MGSTTPPLINTTSTTTRTNNDNHRGWDSQEECVGVTSYCHGRGECLFIDGRWCCICRFGWNTDDACNKTIFEEVYKGQDAFYWIVGLILILPLTIAFIMEIILHIQKNKKAKPVFFVKILCLLFGVLRIVYFSIYGCMSVSTIVSEAIGIASGIIFTLGVVCGELAYFMVTVMWLDLVISLEKMSLTPSKRYKIAKQLLLYFTVLFIPVSLAITVVMNYLFSSLLYTIFLIWLGVPLLITIIFCIIHVYKLHKEISGSCFTAQRYVVTKQKNNRLLIISFFMIIETIGATVLGLDTGHWGWIIIMSVLRLIEISLGCLLFVFSHNYLYDFLFQNEKYYEGTKPTSTTSGAASQDRNKSVFTLSG